MEVCLLTRLSVLEVSTSFLKFLEFTILNGLRMYLIILSLNDFEKCLKASQAGMYADDTQVSLASSSVDELVRKAQDELSNISEWMRLNKLSANPQKQNICLLATQIELIRYPSKKN